MRLKGIALISCLFGLGFCVYTDNDYTCLNDGFARPWETGGKSPCICPPYFTGPNTTSKCQTSICLNGGQSRDDDSCECPPGFLGIHCEPVKCVDQDVGSFELTKKKRDVHFVITYNKNFVLQLKQKDGVTPIETVICNKVKNMTGDPQLTVWIPNGFATPVPSDDCRHELNEFLNTYCPQDQDEDSCNDKLTADYILNEIMITLKEDARLIILSNQGFDDATTNTAAIEKIKQLAIISRIQIHAIVFPPPQISKPNIYDKPDYGALREIAEASMGFFSAPFKTFGSGTFGDDTMLTILTKLFDVFFDYAVLDRITTNDNECGFNKAFFTIRSRTPAPYYVAIRTEKFGSSSNGVQLNVTFLVDKPKERLVYTGNFDVYTFDVKVNSSAIANMLVSSGSGCVATTILLLEKTAELARFSITSDESVDASSPFAFEASSNILVGHFSDYHTTNHSKIQLDISNANFKVDLAVSSRSCQYNAVLGRIQCKGGESTFIRARDVDDGRSLTVQPFYCMKSDISLESHLYRRKPTDEIEPSILAEEYNCTDPLDNPAIVEKNGERTLIVGMHKTDNFKSLFIAGKTSLFVPLRKLWDTNFYKNTVTNIYSFSRPSRSEGSATSDYDAMKANILNSLDDSESKLAADSACQNVSGLAIVEDPLNAALEAKTHSDIIYIADHGINTDKYITKDEVVNAMSDKRARLIALLVGCSTGGGDFSNVNSLAEWNNLATRTGGFAVHFSDQKSVRPFFDEYLSWHSFDTVASRDVYGAVTLSAVNSTTFKAAKGETFKIIVVAIPDQFTLTVNGKTLTNATSIEGFHIYDYTSDCDKCDTVASLIPSMYFNYGSVRVLQQATDKHATIAFASSRTVATDSPHPVYDGDAQYPVVAAPESATAVQVSIYDTRQLLKTEDAVKRYGCGNDSFTWLLPNYNFRCSSDQLYFFSTRVTMTDGTTFDRTTSLRCQPKPPGPTGGPTPSLNCINHGTYIKGPNPSCLCPIHFTGQLCESPLCLNGGRVSQAKDCDCPPDYTGEFCETYLAPTLPPDGSNGTTTTTCNLDDGNNWTPSFRSLSSTVIFLVENSKTVIDALTAVNYDAVFDSNTKFKPAQYVVALYDQQATNILLSTTDVSRVGALLNGQTAPAENITDIDAIPALQTVINAQLTGSSLIFWFANTDNVSATFVQELGQTIAVNRVSIRAVFTSHVEVENERIHPVTVTGGSAFYKGDTANYTDFFKNYIKSILKKTTPFENRLNVLAVYPKGEHSVVDLLLQQKTSIVFVTTSSNVDLQLSSTPPIDFTPIFTSATFSLWYGKPNSTTTLGGKYNIAFTGQDTTSLIKSVEVLNFDQVAYGFTSKEGSRDFGAAAVTGENFLITYWTGEQDLTGVDADAVPTALVLPFYANYSVGNVLEQSTTVRDGCSYKLSLRINCTDDVYSYGITLKNKARRPNSGTLDETQKYMNVPCVKSISCENGIAHDGRCVCEGTGFEGVACELPVCKNGGTRDAGACMCPSGFDGKFCDGFPLDPANTTRAILIVQDVCGKNADLIQKTTRVITNYTSLLNFNDGGLVYLGTNSDDSKAEIKKITSMSDFNAAVADNQKLTCTASSFEKLMDDFNKLLSSVTVRAASTIRIEAAGLHVTQTGVSGNQGAYTNLTHSYNFHMGTVGMTEKNDIFNEGNADNLDKYGKFLGETYDEYKALTFLMSYEQAAPNATLPPPPPRQPSCAHKVQTSLLIATDLSRENANYTMFRQQAVAILKTFVADFNFLAAVPRDQNTCAFNESDVENRALISGTFYTNSTTKQILSFCTSDLTAGYIDSIITNPFISGPLNISGVLATYRKNFKDPTNLLCRCVQNDVAATSKIVIWLPMQSSSVDDPQKLDLNAQGFTDQFEHIVIPFGFDYEKSDLWTSLQKNATYVMPRGDTSSTETIVQKLWTLICKLNGKITGDATAEPPAFADIEPIVVSRPISHHISASEDKQGETMTEWLRRTLHF